MKNKLYLLSILTIIGTLAKAQSITRVLEPTGEPSFGIFAGINFQNINGKDASGIELENDLVLRYNAGVNFEIPIAPEFYIQPGLQFIAKGTKGPMMYTTNSETHTINRELKMNYLEVPISFVFKPLLGNGHMILGFGPYISYALNGKATFTGETVPADVDIQFMKSAPINDPNNLIYFKRMDMGANFFVGYQLANGINILLNSQLGLANINSNTSTKMSNKNTGFGLALGYRILSR